MRNLHPRGLLQGLVSDSDIFSKFISRASTRKRKPPPPSVLTRRDTFTEQVSSHSLYGDSEYSKLYHIIGKHFFYTKLNIKRAEIYIHVHKATKLYRELCLYLVFVVVFFTLVLLVLPAGSSYEHASFLGGSGALFWVTEVPGDQTSFQTMNQREDFYAWLQNKLLPVLSPDNSLSIFSRQLGTVQLRQIRVVGYECEEFYRGNMSICFSEYTEEAEDKASFVGSDSGFIYAWTTGLSMLYPSFSWLRDNGYFHSYGKGGYVQELPRNVTSAFAVVEQLIRDEWISEATRAIVVNLSLYNRHTGLYTSAELLAEFPPSGMCIPTIRINTVKLQPLDNPRLRMWCLVFSAFVGFYIISEIIEIRRRGILGYLLQWWSALEVLNVACFASMIRYFVLFVAESQKVLAEIADDPVNRYIDMATGRHLQEVISNLAAINVFLSSIRVFKFLRLNAKMNVLWTTLALAASDLINFVVIFLILAAGYAFMGHLVFGYRLPGYHNFSASFSSLFQFIGGEADYDELNIASPMGGVIYYFSFMILIFLILVNVFIAIIGRHYEEACTRAERTSRELSSGGFAEEGRTVLSKIRKLELFVVSRLCDVDQLESGDVLKVWLQTTSRMQDAPTPLQSPSVTFKKGMLSKIPSRYKSMTGRTVKCDVKGNPTYVRFIAEVLRTGDVVFLESKYVTGKQRPCKLEVMKMVTNSKGQYMKFVCVRPGVFRTGISLRPSRWVLCKYAISAYLTPISSRYAKVLTYFKEAGLEPPEPIFKDDEVEQLVQTLKAQSTKAGTDSQGDAAPMEFQLEGMLREIYELDQECQASNDTKRQKQVQDLVTRALRLDQMVAELRAVMTNCNKDQQHQLYSSTMAEWDTLDRMLLDLKTGQQVARPSLRFDELLYYFNVLLGKLHRTGYSRVDIKKEAIRVLGSFPLDCFDPLDIDKEKEEYVPRPYDTTSLENSDRDPVVLLGDLIDTLAEILHDQWSLEKLKKGFRYGPKRNDAEKLHDCLKQYELLSDSEKAYDIKMVSETLRIAVHLGYVILPPREAGGRRIGPEPIPNWERYVPVLAPGYVLRWIDLDDISLSDELLELRDLLAENLQNIWAKDRMSEGFRYGSKTDPHANTLHLLVPYGLMTDDDKDSNLKAVVVILKNVLGLGYQITFNRRRHLLQHILGIDL